MGNDGFIDDCIELMEQLNIHDTIGDALENTKDEITEYQKGQMLHGLNSEGKLIGRYKNMDYARKKANMNPIPGLNNVDLKLTGEFQRNIKTVVLNDDVDITSTDEKLSKLTTQYDPNGDIFGLSTEYSDEYSELYLEPEADKLIQNQL